MLMNCTSGCSCGLCHLTNIDKGAIIKASERIVQLLCSGSVGDTLSMVFGHDGGVENNSGAFYTFLLYKLSQVYIDPIAPIIIIYFAPHYT
jgi:hypothetical protein